MIQYDPSVSLSNYREFLVELQKEYRHTKATYYLCKIVSAIVLLSVFIALNVILSLFHKAFSPWLLIPIIIAIAFALFFFKVSIKVRNNSISKFFNRDYKSVLQDIRHDIRTITYFISCLENGEQIDLAYAYVCSE